MYGKLARMMNFEEYAARMGEMRNALIILVG
jgi:hypothetical protein